MAIIGIDLGGTKISAALFSREGELIEKEYRLLGGAVGSAVGVEIAEAIIALRAKNKKEQDERDKEILNTPLETFGDNETTVKAEDLAKKYDTVYKDNDN